LSRETKNLKIKALLFYFFQGSILSRKKKEERQKKKKGFVYPCKQKKEPK
jgi:hypothetical protein